MRMITVGYGLWTGILEKDRGLYGLGGYSTESQN